MPHRSLPDIPTPDQNQDTNSDLYATVGDKVGGKPQGQSRKFQISLKSYFIHITNLIFIIKKLISNILNHSLTATSNVKKQISVSQHSSISQADDCSSPYARVRSPSHGYDKVRNEHPYAQVKAVGDSSSRPSTSATAGSANNQTTDNSIESGSTSRQSSHESLLDAIDGRHQVKLSFFLNFNNHDR